MLFIVATPIGNLDDLSFRQAKTLLNSDYILAEDTRSANILLNEIKKRYNFAPRSPVIISYYKEKEFEKLPEIIDLLKQGKNISLISESGMPLISDPGYLLVKTCIKQNIPFTVIPGASALTTALVYSGFKFDHFMFLSYFPKKKNDIVRLIDQSRQVHKLIPETIYIFYESPKRINKTLTILNEQVPNADICICREMTKMFEEIIRGKAKDLLNRSYKGELTVIINFF